jgi:3-hydroxyisobutyrate dehydrogenase-like beta-hydroxyacid dehydrogenase
MEINTDATSIDRSEPIGFVGLGQMGGPMATHLARLGYPVLVFARNPAAAKDAVAAGARVVPTVRDVACQARIVCICLNTQQATLDIVFGEGGLASGDRIETLIDFSTTGTDFAAQFGQRLLDRGIALLDSPISGNVRSAGNGGLGIMCSGPLRGFRQVEQVMRDLARPMVLYLGERNGNAQRLKGLNNLGSSTGSAIAAELFVLGTKWGLAPEIMLEVLNAGDASCNATRNKFGKDVLTRRFNYGAHIEITSKDTSNTVREGEEIGVPMWVGQSVRQLWKYAEQQGGGRLDGTALITYIEAWAGGVEVRMGANAEPADAAPGPASVGGLVLACDQRVQAVIAERLRSRQWVVAVRGEPAVSDRPVASAAAGRCTLVGLPCGSHARDLLDAVGRASEGARTVVNLCLMPTADSVDLARALHADAGAYVDAAHTGTLRDLTQGRGVVLASAPAALFELLKPLLESLGTKLIRISSRPGAAHLMRNIDQCMADALLGAACESYVVGAKAGIEPLDMVKILGVETGKCTATINILPKLVAARNFDFGKPIGDACDELVMLSEEARGLGVTTWLLDKVRLLYALAAQLGKRDDDVSRLAAMYEQWAAVEIRVGLGKSEAEA